MYDDLGDRCKNEDWFRSQDRITTKRIIYKRPWAKGINLFGKNKPFKESGFYFKNNCLINENNNSNTKNWWISWRFDKINSITLYLWRIYLFIKLYKKKYWPFGFWMCVSNCNKASKLLQIFCQYIFVFWSTTTLLYSMQCVRTKHKNIISRSFCDYLYIIACKSKKSSMKVIPCRDWFVDGNKKISWSI